MFHIPANVNVLIGKMKYYFRVSQPANRHAKRRRIVAKIQRICGFVLLTIFPCRASIVIVTLTSDAIYIGADGRLTLTDDKGKETFDCICKIRKFRTIVVATTGTITDPHTDFDLWKILDGINASSVAEFADKIVTTLPPKYETAIRAQTKRTNTPSGTFIAGDIEVAGFEDGKPASVRVIFISEKGSVKAVKKNDGAGFARDTKRGPGIVTSFPVGMFNAIAIGDYPQCDTTDPVEAIRCTIASYIRADPKHINKPISILKLTSSGLQWPAPGICESKK